MLLGDEALDRLRLSTVVVAGLGGVGAYAAEMTARAGVGRMILIDSDKVSESNKNRQLLALDSTVGQSKTDVMAARLLDINPDLRIVKVPEYLTEDNVADVLDRAMKEMFSVAGVVPNGDDMEQVEVCNGLLNRDSAGTALRPDFGFRYRCHRYAFAQDRPYRPLCPQRHSPGVLYGLGSEAGRHESPSDGHLQVVQLPAGIHPAQTAAQDRHQQGLSGRVLRGIA